MKLLYRLAVYAGVFMMYLLAILPGRCQNVFPDDTVQPYHFPYRITNPDLIYKPDELVELTGMDYYSDSLMACVQELNGIIYLLNLEKGYVEETFRIPSIGKNEGLAVFGNNIFVIKEDGVIYGKGSIQTRDPKTLKRLTFIDETRNLCRGLTFDHQEMRLLILTLGKGNKKNPGRIHVYETYITLRKDSATLLFSINPKSLLPKKQQATSLSTAYGILNADKPKPKPDEIRHFEPSAIAIHPLTHNVYILSNVSRQLLVTDIKGNILHIEELPEKVFDRSMAMAFDPTGNLYIASKARYKAAVLRYNYYPAETKTPSE